jgi:AbrB family looped-hinge helix DNA binding protein
MHGPCCVFGLGVLVVETFICFFVGYYCGKNMSISKVDERNRIFIDKKIRKKTHIKAGDVVVLESLDEHSFKVNILDFTSDKLEDEPAWQIIRTPANLKKYIAPEELEKMMEETNWQE